jgi:hypothetical protein
MPSISPGRATALLAGLLALATLIAPLPARASARPAVTVSVHPASGASGSYFDLTARPGVPVAAGTVEVRSTVRRPLTVLIDPVGSLTSSTLGSAYKIRGGTTGSAAWSDVGPRRVLLAPRGTRVIPISVAVPDGTRAGDYLSGVSVQALTKPRTQRVKGNVAIASVQRYAVGLLVRVPGPRTPLIRLTHAIVKREPAGTTFYVFGRNAGNSVLQNVSGNILITRGKHVVARTQVGPGTFVSGTSIAYPVLAPSEQPREGTAYRVRATMHYGPRVARLDQYVRFGHRDAVRQEQFGGPEAGGGSGIWGKVLLIAVLALLALAVIGLVALLRRRRGGLRRATERLLERAIADAGVKDEPLTALLVSLADGTEPGSTLARMLARRVRHSDVILRVPGKSLVVLAHGTDVGAAAALAAEIRKYVVRRANGALVVELVPLWPDRLGDDLLLRPAQAWVPPAADRADVFDADSISVDALMRERDRSPE